MLDKIRSLPLWQQMASKVNATELAMVERHVSHILPQLEHYVDTFPTYTLHNREHIYNLINIMGLLMGDKIDLIHGIEAMVLVLSAAYHDLGMVYSADERRLISTYENFNREFLPEQPRARVLYEENKSEVSDELAQWYCRWAHAVRVWPKMDEVEVSIGRLLWNDMPIREALGHVCASHNEPAENIRVDDERFPPDYFKVCDLRFCALMLRLADILDFDNSRSPKSVYDFLDLGNPKNHAEEISRDEWQKHMASRGFQFPPQSQTTALFFSAAPRHPFVEQGIRSFLDLIDFELAAAAKVSGLCSDRWQRFPFPEKIDRRGIKSDNYLSGKFRFSLSEDKILELLTGDNLYNDDFVFIRELLQNAIDTVRHRAFIECISDPKYIAQAIEVSYFKDPDGYYWLRMDDHGMGLSQYIIERYLLKKGNSYYQSDDFKLEKISIREKIHRDFVPISRFGIGLLSCFMTCDRIEINTCYYYAAEGHSREKIRLSIEGRAGYWVIRSEKKHHSADKMPHEKGWERGYRNEVGTSIACRIKTSREFRGLNMESQIDRFLLAPEIPVQYQGKLLGGNREELAMTPWCKHSRTSVPEEFIHRCTNLLKMEVEQLDLEIRPIDFAKVAANSNLIGQLVLVVPRIKVKNGFKGFSTEKYFKFQTEGKSVFLVCEVTEKDKNGREIKIDERQDVTTFVDTIHFPEKFLADQGSVYPFRWPQVSHNGVIVYDNEHQLQVHLPDFDQYQSPHFRNSNFFLSTGLYCFRDELLPELTVSRSTIRQFTPEIIAHIMYATREMNEYIDENGQPFSYLPDLEHKQRRSELVFSVEMFERVGLYELDKEYWNNLPSLSVRNQGYVSMGRAVELAKERPIEFHFIDFRSVFYREFVKYMVVKNFIVRYIPTSDGYYLDGRPSDGRINITEGMRFFNPLEFIESIESTKIVLKNRCFNQSNSLIKWFLNYAVLIKKEFSYYGYQIFNILLAQDPPKAKVAELNEILERLRTLLPIEARPAKDLNITEENL
jgi:hypothetical protein